MIYFSHHPAILIWLAIACWGLATLLRWGIKKWDARHRHAWQTCDVNTDYVEGSALLRQHCTAPGCSCYRVIYDDGRPVGWLMECELEAAWQCGDNPWLPHRIKSRQP